MHGVVVDNCNNCWTSDDVVISWLVGVLGKDNVLLTWLSTRWDDDGVLGTRTGELSRDWTHGGDEVSGLSIDALGDGEGELVTWLGNASWGDGDGWESNDWELWVGGRAALDELGGEGVDLVEVEWDVEWCWEWRLSWALVLTEVSGVARLHGEDGASGGEVVLVHDELGGTEVGADTDTLEDVGDGKEGCCILEAEVVCACLNWCDTSSCTSSAVSTCQRARLGFVFLTYP